MAESFDNFLAEGKGNAPEPLISGTLYKRPEKNSLLWKKRYCVIYKNASSPQIVYFESEEAFQEGRVRGKISFSSVHAWDGKPYGIQFYTPTNKLYRVYCENDEEQKQWLSTMQQAIDATPDMGDGTSIPHDRPVVSSPTSSPKSSDASPEKARSFRKARQDSWREEDGDTAAMTQELEDLRSEVATLRAELVSYEKTEQKFAPEIKKLRTRRGSILDDGTEVDLNPREMERMRGIFDLFDTQGNGCISEDDLIDLHAKLGEPITAEEAKEAAAYMQPEGGKIDFDSFIKWWNDDHSSSSQTEAMKRYQAKFKFLKARIANPQIGNLETLSEGPFPSFEFRLQFFHNNPKDGTREQISPWHDIPLYNADGSVNFICEIPKWTRKKMEIATGEPFNPIKQDTKNGKLREYTWGDMMFNYGCLPQTWEDPAHVTEGTGCIGDNDPIDVLEIGTKQWRTGAVVQVKILGVLALIDDGETDWKVLCINVEDHYASQIHDVADIEAHMPGCITAIHDWFRDYKAPKVNKYGFEGRCLSRDFAEDVVAETHEFWKLLIQERGGQATV